MCIYFFNLLHKFFELKNFLKKSNNLSQKSTNFSNNFKIPISLREIQKINSGTLIKVFINDELVLATFIDFSQYGIIIKKDLETLIIPYTDFFSYDIHHSSTDTTHSILSC